MTSKKVGYAIIGGVYRAFTGYYKLKNGRVRIYRPPGRVGKKYGLKYFSVTVDEKQVISYPDK